MSAATEELFSAQDQTSTTRKNIFVTDNGIETHSTHQSNPHTAGSQHNAHTDATNNNQQDNADGADQGGVVKIKGIRRKRTMTKLKAKKLRINWADNDGAGSGVALGALGGVAGFLASAAAATSSIFTLFGNILEIPAEPVGVTECVEAENQNQQDVAVQDDANDPGV